MDQIQLSEKILYFINKPKNKENIPEFKKLNQQVLELCIGMGLEGRNRECAQWCEDMNKKLTDWLFS